MSFDILGPAVYGPNPESPIAERIEHALMLHLAPGFSIHREYPCPTPWARFRIDLVLTDGSQIIGIECDGREFHDQFSDETRDSMILGLGLVDTIWRFRGADINFSVHDCLYVMSKFDGSAFTERGRQVLATQACDTAKEYEPESTSRIVLTRFNRQENAEPLQPRRLEIVRNSRVAPWKAPRPFWESNFDEIKDWQGMSFDEVVAKQRQQLKDWLNSGESRL